MAVAQWLAPVAWLSALCLVAGCTITTQVQPIPRDVVKAVCIKENPATWSKGLLPVLRAQFERRGISTSVYTQEPPTDCPYRVEYDASWSWDLAVYLVYLDIRILEGTRTVGRATYDARDGSGRFDKFGTTEGKMEPLITRMLTGSSATEN